MATSTSTCPRRTSGGRSRCRTSSPSSCSSTWAAKVGPDPRPLVFTGRTGTPLRYGSWHRWTWAPALRAAGLEDVTPPDLRARHGSWVARSHGIMAAAKRLGHSNANVTTRHYARVVDDRDAEIAASFQPITHDLGARGGHEQGARSTVSDLGQGAAGR